MNKRIPVLELENRINETINGYENLLIQLRGDFKRINQLNTDTISEIEKTNKLLVEQQIKSESLKELVREISTNIGLKEMSLEEVIKKIEKEDRNRLTLKLKKLLDVGGQVRKQNRMNLDLLTIMMDIRGEMIEASIESAKRNPKGNNPMIFDEEY